MIDLKLGELSGILYTYDNIGSIYTLYLPQWAHFIKAKYPHKAFHPFSR